MTVTSASKFVSSKLIMSWEADILFKFFKVKGSENLLFNIWVMI